MFGLNVTYLLKDGMREKFLSEIDSLGLQRAVLSEKGCLQYEYFRAVEDENKLLLVERWESREAQALHLTQHHMSAMSELKATYAEDTVLDKYDL